MRLPDGRFQVELPFKNETSPDLDFTPSTASRCYTLLGKVFFRNDHRQIALEKSAKDFHRFVWRWNANDVLKHFRVTWVTYGIASSMFHSIRSLFEAAIVNSDKIASSIIEHDF